MFQYVCKKVSYDWVEYEYVNKRTGHVETTRLQAVNRAFAMKNDDFTGMLYKYKTAGKTTKAKIPSLPDSVFVHNDEILSDKAIDEILPEIDFDYYVRRAYERISEFIELEQVKKVYA